MQILFVYTIQDSVSSSKPLRVNDQIQLGISYIASMLRRAGHEIELLVMTRETSLSVLERWVRDSRPGLLAFTAMSSEFPLVRHLARQAKARWPDLYRAVGGVHATLHPREEYLEDFDALCVGEGEHATVELVEALEAGERPSGIANFWFRAPGGGVEKNACRPYIEDLDSLPFPDREMWRRWIRRPESRNFLLMGRGCPYPCTYCLHHAVKDLAEGTYVRLREPRRVLEEIEELADRFEANEIYLEVETFNLRKGWVLDLCRVLGEWNRRREEPVTFGANIRIVNHKNYDEILEAMAWAGVRFINIGLESGSDRVRREILLRSYSNRDVIRTVETARSHWIRVTFQNMLGMPGERWEDFLQTVALNRRCQPDWHHISIFEPYPGIRLYDTCEEMGLLDEELDNEMIRCRAVLDLPGFSRRQIQRGYEWFDYLVYRGRRPWLLCLASVLVRKMKSRYGLNRLYRRFMTGSAGWFLRNLWDGNYRWRRKADHAGGSPAPPASHSDGSLLRIESS